MNRLELIEILSSIIFVCKNEQDDEDRRAFEYVVTTKPELGLQCLYLWMSKYYVSLKTKALIERYALTPNWSTFHTAAHFLMLDRVIAAVALDGQVTSRISDCIQATLKCGENIDEKTLHWVEFYTGSYSEQKFVA